MARWIPSAFFIMLGITVINLLWLIPARDTIYSSASVLAREVADRLRSNMETGLENSLDQVYGVANEIAQEPNRTDAALGQFLTRNPHFQDISVVDRNGRELVRIDRMEGVIATEVKDHSHDPLFYAALRDAPNFWNVQSSPDGRLYTTLAIPVKQETGIVSVIIADLNIDNLIRAQDVARFRATSYLVDRDGFIILGSNPEEVAKRRNVGNRPIVQKVVIDGREADGLERDDAYTDDAGVPMFAVGLPIPVAGWGIFVEQPRSQALAGERIITVFAGIAWLLGLGIVFVIFRSSYRLGGLNERLNELLKENYDVGKILVHRDIELTEANNRLMALDASKSEFVSVAAHQLRTPITGIRWSFNAMLDRELGEITSDQEKVLQDGLKSSIRMIDLINDLLNVARIEEGRFGLRFRKQPLSPLIQGVVERHRQAIDEKGILLLVDVEQGLQNLNLDEEKINIALDNLMDNAIKYTAPGGTVTIRAVEDKEIVRVSVSDTGIGVPKDQMEKLFVKFFRADNALRFQTSGSGLGLYVVKNVVESHGGTIKVESEENKGTSFVFTIPIPK